MLAQLKKQGVEHDKHLDLENVKGAPSLRVDSPTTGVVATMIEHNFSVQTLDVTCFPNAHVNVTVLGIGLWNDHTSICCIHM